MKLLFGMPRGISDTYMFSRHPPGDIYLVEDLTLAKKLFEEGKLKDVFGKYNSLEEYIEDYIEVDLSHEVIHIVLDRLEGLWVCMAFDNLDRENGITDFPSDYKFRVDSKRRT